MRTSTRGLPFSGSAPLTPVVAQNDPHSNTVATDPAFFPPSISGKPPPPAPSGSPCVLKGQEEGIAFGVCDAFMSLCMLPGCSPWAVQAISAEGGLFSKACAHWQPFLPLLFSPQSLFVPSLFPLRSSQLFLSHTPVSKSQAGYHQTRLHAEMA